MAELTKSEKQLIVEAENFFKKTFNNKADIKAFAPGRVNIIGEHTDYNDGFVFPMAIPMGTVIVGKKNNLNECRVYTMADGLSCPTMANFKITSGDIVSKSELIWANYVIGVVTYFPSTQKDCFDAVINNSVPLGSGLSSSASLEVAVYTFLEGLYSSKDTLSLAEKALICQKAEHNYANVPCGIMDQFISLMGKQDQCLFIDCRDLSSKLVKMSDDTIDILIVNSNVKHNLGSSEYPLRREHCHMVARTLGKKALRDISLQELQEVVSKIDPIQFSRAKHVISENQRVLDSIEALEKSDFVKLGHLMNDSHRSLRDDFDVSCKEVDLLVEITQPLKGVLGSRMTGGGFGGCTVSLVHSHETNNVIASIKKLYPGKPLFYVCKPSNGAHLCC